MFLERVNGPPLSSGDFGVAAGRQLAHTHAPDIRRRNIATVNCVHWRYDRLSSSLDASGGGSCGRQRGDPPRPGRFLAVASGAGDRRRNRRAAGRVRPRF